MPCLVAIPDCTHVYHVLHYTNITTYYVPVASAIAFINIEIGKSGKNWQDASTKVSDIYGAYHFSP